MSSDVLGARGASEVMLCSTSIIHHSETYLVECEYGTDAESESGSSDNEKSNDDEYNFEELEIIKMQKSGEVNKKLSHYKELYPSMTFKDLNEARRIVNLYALANAKPIVVEKSDRTRLRYRCMIACPFVLLISKESKGPGFRIKTLNINHNCEDAFKNPRACTNTKMTCSKCGSSTHNARTCKFGTKEQEAILKKKRDRIEEEEEQVEDVHDFNSSALIPTQEEEYHFMSTPGLSQQHCESFGSAKEIESDPDIRPQVISEYLTKLKMRMNQQRPSGNRVISFRGDHAGICEPQDLPYSPTKLIWNGKEAVSSNQLEREKEKKLCKLKTKKANRTLQI